MSKDIRSFFKVAAKKETSTVAKSSSSPFKSKRKANILDSDDEKEPVKKVEVKKKRRIVDSDEEQDVKPSKKSSPAKKPEKKKLVEVADVHSMFGSEPVRRKERPKVEKKSPNTSSTVINLEDEDDTMDLDLSAIVDSVEKKEALKKKVLKESPAPAEVKKSSAKEEEERKSSSAADFSKSSVSSSKSPSASTSKSSPSKSKPKDKTPKSSPIKDVKPVKKESTTPDKKSSKGQRSGSPSLNKSKSTPTRAIKTPSSAKTKEKKVKEMTAEDDEKRQERKELARAGYQKFLNRSTVIDHGCKEIPKGKPNCLKGHQFVISGVLESMTREEAADLIKSLGGIVVSGLSKKVTHLLIGEEAGPQKLANAQNMGIKLVSEDDLLNLIRVNSGIPVVMSEVNAVEVKKDSPGKENRVKNEVVDPPTPEVKKKKELSPSPTDVQKTLPATTSTENLDLSLVDKYKPTSMKQIIGQQGPSGNATKLQNWLTKWPINNDGKKKHAKPNPWAKDNDGSAYKAALLSGGPGVGKTTTAHLVSQELLFEIVEFNASDTRSKKSLQEEVAALLSNTSISGYAQGTSTKPSKRRVLIMDEVDGMAGNEDRGGVAEMIALIKNSQVPIICMCNDRNHPKIRSLANYCFDLRFHKPSIQMIRGAMMSICFKEGIKLEPGAIDEIITGTGNDIRQTLNHLALYSASKDTKLGVSDAKKNAQASEKDIKMSQFEATRKVFSAEEHKKMSFNDRFDLFFYDYNMAPLFVQENYLHSKPNVDKPELLRRVAKAADSLSTGDLIEKKIRSSMAWSLLPTQAAFSSVLPGEYMEGTFSGAVNFPGWLGKTSKANKRKRLAQELNDHTRIATSGSRLSVRLDYAPFLVQAIVRPLKEKGVEGVPEALEVIKEYRLLREDIDGLLELTTWPKMKNPWESIDSKVKAALTRAYNKEVQPYSFSAQAGVKKKAGRSADNEEVEGYENEEGGDVAAASDEEEEDSLENNALIKVKKPTTAKAPKAGISKAGTSKAGSSKAKSKK